MLVSTTANTDTKHTWNLTRHIYRFVPASTDLIKGFHTVDERCVLVPFSSLLLPPSQARSRPHALRRTRLNLLVARCRIHIDAHISTIRWYHQLLRNTETWQAP